MELHSVTWTSDEISVVTNEAQIPKDEPSSEKGWTALKVQGPLDFSLTGILANLSDSLARAEIPIFVVSTFDTDYLLVRTLLLGLAKSTLIEAGHEFVSP